tara:strand:- start:95 stop:343 length:249 start_codon:yes stop_codon:yes gene_type:complete
MFLVFVGILKPYYNGDTYGYVVRYWNPISYLWVLSAGFFIVIMGGLSEFNSHKEEIGLKLSTYFKENPDQLEYVSLLELLKG